MGRLSFKLLACCFGKANIEEDKSDSLKQDPVTETCEGLEKSKCDPVIHIRVLEDSHSQEISFSSTELPATFGTGPDCSFCLQNSGNVQFRIGYDESQGFEVERQTGAGPFFKVIGPVEVGEELGVNFGYENYMRLAIVTGSMLKVQFLEGEKAGLTLTFRPKDSPVHLGRMKDCKLKFDDAGLSRYQCVLLCESGRWQVQDGDGVRASTNGTWALVKGKKTLQGSTLLKAGGVLIEAAIAI